MPECHLLEKLLGRETDTMHEEQTDFFKKIKSLSNCAGKQKSIYKNQYDPRFALLEEILIESHPAMTEVIDFLCSELILSARQERPSPRPILMVGQPGIGKTHFARSLANVTGAPFINFSCATADAPWALTGSNSTWNKGKPSSFIFEIARTNAHAGVFFCDEANEGNQDIHEPKIFSAEELFKLKGQHAVPMQSAPGFFHNENWHTHILFSTREMTPIGFGKKTRVLDDGKTGRVEIEKIRQAVADMINAKAREAGIDLFMHSKSARRRGSPEIPTIPLGQKGHWAAKRGLPHTTAELNQRIAKHNRTLTEADFDEFLKQPGFTKPSLGMSM